MSHSDSHHSFSMELAEIYGVNEAIVIHHLQHWIKINRRMKRNFHEERTWTYQTQAEIAASMPYFSEDVVFRLIKKLEKEGVILKGNFNKHPFDKTVWYAFVDEVTFIGENKDSNNFTDTAESRLAFPEIAEAIPYPIPDPKPSCMSAVADSEKSKENLPSRIQKKKANGEVTETDLSLIMHYAIKNKTGWATNEIEEAWKILDEYSGAVNDLIAFISGTIKKIRNKKNFKNMENSLCKNQQQTTKPKGLRATEENGSQKCWDPTLAKQLFPTSGVSRKR